MKKALLIATLALAFPVMASAATVTVYPITTNAHGGTANASNMTVCIASDCEQGVPTFTLPDGTAYQVTFQPAAGYSYSADDNCAGVAQGDITCTVNYADGAPIAPSAPVAPAPIVSDAAPAVTAAVAPLESTTTLSAADQAQIDALEQVIALLEQILALLQAQHAQQ